MRFLTSVLDKALGRCLLRIYAMRLRDPAMTSNEPSPFSDVDFAVVSFMQAIANEMMSEKNADLFELARCALYRLATKSPLKTLTKDDDESPPRETDYGAALKFFDENLLKCRHCPECGTWGCPVDGYSCPHNIDCPVLKRIDKKFDEDFACAVRKDRNDHYKADR